MLEQEGYNSTKSLSGRNEANVYEYHAMNEHATEYLACQLADSIRPGTVITLDGEMGAGKTKFVQALAYALNVQEIVSSPTFMLIKEYVGQHLPIYHMDMYRIQIDEALDLGLDEYFFGKGVTLIEWAERIQSLLPLEHLSIYIEKLNMTERKFRFMPYGEQYEELCVRLKKNGIWI
jgi:tRNA threonylcarbamoyladenosine biosynthesis protein TsaE